MVRSGHDILPILPSEALDNILEESWGFACLSRRVGPSDMVSTPSICQDYSTSAMMRVKFPTIICLLKKQKT